MKTKYAVRDIVTGEYVFTPKEDIPNTIAKFALDFYLAHTNKILYSTVQLNIDGSETWKTPEGTEMVPEMTVAKMEEQIKNMIGVTVL